jgi:SAM-dependent methyltransferase
MGNDRLGVSVVILHPLDRNGYKMIKDRLLSSMEDLDLEFIENPKMSSGDIIIFLSPIDLPAEDWLKNILQTLTESDVGVVGSKIIDNNGKVVHSGIVFDKDFNPYFIYSGLDKDFYGVNKYRYFNCIYYEGMAIRREILQELGWFDIKSDLFTENLRICYLLKQKGIKPLYNPKAVLQRRDNYIKLYKCELYPFPQDDILVYQEDTVQINRSLLIRRYNINPPVKNCILCHSQDISFIESIGEYDIYKCLNCGLEFSNPMKAPDYSLLWESAEDYRHRIENWNNLYNAHEDPNYIEGYYIVPIEIIRTMSEIGKNLSLLEVGFGEGLFLYDAYKFGFDVYGMEASDRAVEIAKSRIPVGRFICSKAFEIPSNWPEKYDVISAFEVLEHLENPKDFIDFAYSHLKPGGILILCLPNKERIGTKYGNIGIMDNPPHHLTRWEKKTLEYILSKYPWYFYKVIGTKPHFNVIFSSEGLSLPPNIVITKDNERLEIKSLDIIKLWREFFDKLISYLPRSYGRILQSFSQKEGKSNFDLKEILRSIELD